jgi:prefoldin subunit 5
MEHWLRPTAAMSMCEVCDDLQKKIDQYSRALEQPLDALTQKRLSQAVQEFQQLKVGMHKDGAK